MWKHISVVKYADDVTFLHSIRDTSEDKLQVEWSNLVQWSTENELPINTAKCRVMDIVTKKSMTLKPIMCDPQCSLLQVSSLRLLGVTLSSDMKWDVHFDSVLEKARKRIFVLSNLRRSLCSPDLMYRTYCALLRSVISYAHPVFCNAPRRLWKKWTNLSADVSGLSGPITFLALKKCWRLRRNDYSSQLLRTNTTHYVNCFVTDQWISQEEHPSFFHHQRKQHAFRRLLSDILRVINFFKKISLAIFNALSLSCLTVLALTEWLSCEAWIKNDI